MISRNGFTKPVAGAAVCAAALLAFSTSAQATTLSGVGTFTGNAGVGTANGDVTAAPVGDGSFVWVSTNGGVSGAAGYGLVGETNGTELTTFSFTAAANDVLEYYFNYVTSDGSGFADYSYVTLNNLDTATDINLFNARTTPSGNTVPGFGLPAIDPAVTLNPMTTAIIAGATNWNVLGASSGACFQGVTQGCGATGWIQSTYTILAAGTYTFTFGVTNWNDTSFDSALAIAGLTVGDNVIIGPPDTNVIPLPAAGWMLIAGIGGLAAMRRRKKADA